MADSTSKGASQGTSTRKSGGEFWIFDNIFQGYGIIFSSSLHISSFR
jgi:hypothetical protein